MASTERREYAGGAKPTTISTDITAASTAITVDDPTGWPTGAVGVFFAVLDRGQAAEEKIKLSARSGNGLTVTSRGVDGTAAAAHSAGASIEHIWTADDADLVNQHTSGDQTDPHPEYQTEAEGDARYPLKSLVDAKGDLLVGSAADSLARQAAGANGSLLVYDSGQTNGVRASLPATNAVTTTESTSSTSYTDLTTAGPAVTATVGASGMALVIVSAEIRSDTADKRGFMTCAVSGASTVAAPAVRPLLLQSSAAGLDQGAGRTQLLTGLTPGSNTFTAKYSSDSGATASFSQRQITVIPL